MSLVITIVCLALVWLWELFAPRRHLEFPVQKRRVGNLGIWLFNIITSGLVFAPHRPLLHWPVLDPVLGAVTGFLLLDLLSYLLHRAQHAVPILWRLHALHHSDPDIDATTSVRHHPIEFLTASGVFWLAIFGLGVPIGVAAVHGSAVFILAVLTHCNTRWPRFIEQSLRPALITLDLHLVHHSAEAHDLNRNFGAVFSVWDRLFRTYAPPLNPEPAYGVPGLSRTDACKPTAMLLTPWRLR